MDLIFDSDIVNILLNTSEWRDRGRNFVVFVVGVLKLSAGGCRWLEAESLV